MLLQNKNAVIYGAGGSLGGAISKALAKAGATVYLSGHHLNPVQQLADEINKAGGKAEAAEVDALNEKSVNDHVNAIAKKASSIDISFCLISLQDLQGVPLSEMSLEDFSRPIKRAIESQFITNTAAGRIMAEQRSGVILCLTATPGGIGYPETGGFGPACRIMECMATNLASELGKYGIRVVSIRSAGSPDSQAFKDALEHGGERAVEFIKKIEDDTMLNKMPVMDDIANTAVFLASDKAAGITGVAVDVTCGTTSALNYKVAPIAFVNKEY
jgi:3-oxoacyl-[acyl-carrier protein] reductase